MRVLVTDGENRAALAVTRSLGRRGHHVVVGDRRRRSLAQASRYCAARVVYPDPAIDERGFVEVLLGVVRDRRIDVLMPVSDITTLLVTENRREFEKHCRLPLAPADAIALAADKVAVLQSATRLGIPVPRTIFVENAEAARSAVGAIPYPIVIKPRRSRLRTPSGWSACSVGYAWSEADLMRAVEASHPQSFPLILQERIEGPGLGVFLCYQQGKPVAVFSHRRLREKPPSGGVSVLSESTPVCPVARQHAEALLGELGWHGVAMVEFKVDRRDGIPKLMEINGRFWGSLQLAIDAGVDFPAIALETLESRPAPPSPDYRVGVRSRWFWGDVDALLLQLLHRNDGGAQPAMRRRAVIDFLKLWQPNLRYENPRLSDLGPWLYETTQWLKSAAPRWGRRVAS